METRARKKLRENERAGDSFVIAGSSNLSAKEEEEIIPTIPALVAHIFLTNLRVVRILKSCRLVCKSWNFDATLSLRVCSKVFLEEVCTNQIIDIRKLLLKRKSGPLKNLPSPFQIFKADVWRLDERDFVKLFLLPNFKLTGLILNWNYELVLSQLGLLLAANQNSITNLNITVEDDNDGSYEELLANNEIKLRALKSFKIKDECNEPCEHIDIVNHIISACNLERIVFDLYDDDLLTNVLTQDKVGNLKHLSIIFWGITVKVLNHLNNLKFPKLKSLAFKASTFEIDCETRCLHKLNQFFQSVAPFLTDFATSFPISSGLTFPNLVNLKVRNNTLLSAINPENFPALSKVHFKVSDRLISYLENDIDPHPCVESIVINTRIQYQGPQFNKSMLKLLAHLSRQFPKVSTLVVNLHRIENTNLGAICEAFPLLKTLGLKAVCRDVSLFCGPNCSEAPEVERRNPLRETPHQKSIMDFMELEHILLHQDFLVHPSMLTHCLPEVPKLRQLTLDWNEQLSANLLGQHFSHLDKIFITNSHKIHQDKMDEVSKLPNVYMQSVAMRKPYLC